MISLLVNAFRRMVRILNDDVAMGQTGNRYKVRSSWPSDQCQQKVLHGRLLHATFLQER